MSLRTNIMPYYRVQRLVQDPSATSTSSSSGAPGTNQDTWITINRSCDLCRVRKRKCDGDGVKPCSRCVAKCAGSSCVYSKRRPQKPRARRARAGASSAGSAVPMLTFMREDEATRAPSSQSGVQFLKRCRLSASPATGLVGMEENVLLGDYFDCLSFLPLTCQSNIREAMVKIMTAKASRQYSRPRARDEKEGRASSPRMTDVCEASSSTPGVGASACIFWCAVALGGLVQGKPVETVAPYVRLAEVELGSREPDDVSATPNMVKAWTILAYAHGFCRDEGNFHRYLRRCHAYVRDSCQEDMGDPVPVGFVELVHHPDDISFLGGRVTLEEMESFCSRPVPYHPLSAFVTEGEMYRWVMQSYRRFGQAFMLDVFHAQGGADAASGAGGAELDDVDVEGSGQVFLGDDREWPTAAGAKETGNGMANASCVVEGMLARLTEFSTEFERLEQAVERPSIRAGMGGIIINGTLVFAKAARHDVPGLRERMRRCVDVFERYPGICRFTMGQHIAHVMLAALAETRVPELFDKVRNAYNAVLSAGTVPIKPLDEWEGLSAFCTNMYCRSWERLIGSGGMTFQYPNSSNQQHAYRESGTISDPHDTEDLLPDKNGHKEQTEGLSLRPCREPENNDCCGARGECGTCSPVSFIDVGIGGCAESAMGDEEWGAALPQASTGAREAVGLATTTCPFNDAAAGVFPEVVGSASGSSDDRGQSVEGIEQFLAEGEADAILTALSGGSDLFQDTEDVFSTDWLDFTHAMLDQVDAGSGEL